MRQKNNPMMRIAVLGTALVIALTQQTEAESYEYDSLNRVTKVIYEDGSYVTYQYDAAGNITESKLYEKKESEAGNKPGGDEPGGGDEPSPDEPGGDEPTPDEPGGDEPTPDEPGGNTPTPDKPTGNDNPGGGNSGGNAGTNTENTSTQGSAEKAGSTVERVISVESKKATYTIVINEAGEGAASFTGLKDKKKTSYTVPYQVAYESVNYPVTEIADNAFKNCQKLKKITISKNIVRIGKNAFYGDKKLKKITVKTENLKEIGKNALKEIHKDAVIKVPKKKLKEYTKLFKGKGQKKSVRVKK